MKRLIPPLVALLLIQGCASTGSKNQIDGWDNSKSTALNILQAIDVDDVEEDRELPKEFDRIERENGEIRDLTTGVVVGAGASEALFPATGGMDAVGSIGIGVMAWMTSGRDERYDGDNYIALYVPADTKGTPEEIFADVFDKAAKAWSEEYNKTHTTKMDLQASGMLTRFGSEIPGYKTKIGKGITNKYVYKITDFGVLDTNQLPPTIRNSPNQWRLLSAEAYWNNFSYTFSKHLPDTAYHYLINSRKYGNNPIILNKGTPYFFIKPSV